MVEENATAWGLGGILMQCPYDLGSVPSLDLGFPVCEKEGPHSS